MSRLIINYDSSIETERALQIVVAVVCQGRVSNNGRQFCYVTTFKKGKGMCVSDLTRKGTDVLTITQGDRHE